MNKQLLDEIIAKLREAYPDAASVTLFVNHQEYSIDVRMVDTKKAGFSMKSLNGEWIE